MASAFNTMGATPQSGANAAGNGPQLTMGGTPQSSALNIASNPSLKGLSSTIAIAPLTSPQSNLPSTVQPGGVMSLSAHNMGVSAGLIPQSTTQTDAAGNTSKITWTSGEGNSVDPSQNSSLLNVPNGQGGYISGTPQGVSSTLSGQSQQTQPENNQVPTPVPNASYGGLINAATNSATNSPFVTQEQNLINQAAGLSGQLANAEGTVSNTPGLLGTRSGTAANIANAYGAEMQGLAQTGQLANAAQGTQQQGLLGAGSLASPANAIVTPPAGQVSTNVLTGQQYSNPVLAPVGTQSFYSPQPGGTAGQPATAGQPTQYTVQSGDTFDALASQYGTTAAAIEAANPGVNPNDLQVGQKVNIPTSQGQNTPFTGGQAQAQAQLGETYVTNNATILAAQGIQQKLNADITQNNINATPVNAINAVQQWLAGNLSNPAYQNFYQDMTDYAQTIAPLIGIQGTPTDMKTAIGQQLLAYTNSGQTLQQGLENLNQLAINKNNANLSAGSAPVGQGALPAGQAAAANTTTGNYTASDGNTYNVQYTNGQWVVQ